VKELAQTIVLALSLDEASVKIRTGGPADDEQDIEDGTSWAGVLPLTRQWEAPVPSPDLRPGWEIPAHVTDRSAALWPSGTRAH
jgi:hypothetical protein